MTRPAPLSDIPANIVMGRRGAGQYEVIRSLLELRAPGERWAVLRNAEPAGIESRSTDTPGVSFSSVADGCICCDAQIELRVALTRLLREARPQRVLIEPSHQARLADVLRLLSDRWFGPVLDMRATIVVVDAGMLPEFGEAADALDRERFASSELVVIRRGSLLAPAALAALEAFIAAAAPGVRVLHSGRDALSMAELDGPPRARPRPRFWRDESDSG